MQNNIINTENNSNNNIIEINNNNAKYYEKLSENYADDARKSAVNCSEYFMLIQRIKNDCEAIKQYVDRDFIGELTAHTEDIDNPHFVTAEQVGAYTKEELADVATSGNYDDLTNKPTIPTIPSNVSYFTNDVGYLTGINSSDIITALSYTPYNGSVNPNGYITSSALSGYASSSDIPTAMSDLTNDCGYVTSSALNGYVQSASLSDVAISGSYNDLTNKPSIPVAQVNSDWNASSGVAQILNKPTIPTVPTNVSAFTNDSGYVTKSIQTLQDISTTTATISLADNTSFYKITPSGATTLTFSNGTSASASKSYTFELCVDMSTVYALTFPNSVTWQDGETPDLSATGTYFLAFRTMDGGTTWLGNLQGRW